MVRKFLYNFSIVALVVFVLDWAIGETLEYFYFHETTGAHYSTTYAIDSTRADVLIFGSSRATHHYVPEVFEDMLSLSYYNTGRDGHFIFYQTAVLKAILKRYSPQVIILDHTGAFDNGREDYDRMSSLLPYYENHEEMREILELRSPYERIKLLSHIYPYNSMLLTIGMGNSSLNKKRKKDRKGYIPMHKNWPYPLDSAAQDPVYAVNAEKLKAFRDFITMAKEAGNIVMVINSPVNYLYDKSQTLEICQEICAAEEVPYYDFSRDTTFLNHREFFADTHHLNDEGAKFLSAKVALLVREKLNQHISGR